MTVRVTGYVPPVAYVCTGDTPLPVVLSPKFHAYDAIVPSGSDEDDANVTTVYCAVEVNDAFGGALTMTTSCVTELGAPRSSVTVSVTE